MNAEAICNEPGAICMYELQAAGACNVISINSLN